MRTAAPVGPRSGGNGHEACQLLEEHSAEQPPSASEFDDILGGSDSALDRAFAFSTFEDKQAANCIERRASLRDLAQRVHTPTARLKGALPLLKLARFGADRSDKGALRHNGNVVEVTGVEGDYDAEKLTMQEGAARLRSANIAALLYTSPSHSPEAPRWRVLCPLNRGATAADRERLCARLNGALGGILSGESYTLSQAYYYGVVRGAPAPEVALVDGRPIDTAWDLDASAVGRDGKPYRSPTAAPVLPLGTDDADEDDDWEYQRIPDWERVDSALAAIRVSDADDQETGGRDLWLRIGQALHHESGGSAEGLARWDAWSSGGAKYESDAVQTSWKSFGRTRGKRIGIGSLYHLAKGYGWGSAAEDVGAIDAIDAIGTAINTGTKPKAPTLPLIDPAGWFNLDVPEREWALRHWIPAGQATYLTGPGSAGKSLLSQQLATCIAMGVPFLGIETQQARALYLTCEDDALELHRRQKAICESLDVSLRDLSGRLFLASLTGETDTELCTFTDKGELRATPRYTSLETGAKEAGITFVALDNVAHLFSGNENARHDVASFVSLLNRLAMRIGGTVLFIGHPNKAGDSFSGSTAWENQVRSRLFLETPGESDDGPADRDVRVLSRQKANYAKNGEQVRFRWHEWAFSLEGELPDAVSEATRARLEDQAFMACLSKTATELRAVSPNQSASNYAPRVFAKMPMGMRITLRGFERALQRLLDRGVILNGQKVYQRDNRSWATGLGPAQTPAQNPHKAVHQPCKDPSTNPAQSRTHTGPYTTYTAGGADDPPPAYTGEVNLFDADAAEGGV